jgi:hypothetical protein
MRRKFRGRAVPQKETAPVRFPDSYDQENRIRQDHHVRISGLKLLRSTALMYSIDQFDRL